VGGAKFKLLQLMGPLGSSDEVNKLKSQFVCMFV